MDITRLHSIDPWTWTVPRAAGDARHEARLYGSRELLAAMDDKVLEQITNVARLPGLVGAALAMPDAHWGYGFPIGGVAAFDPEHGGIISAGGVGFDISCGIRCLRTNLTADDIAHKAAALADSLLDQIPAGVGVEGSLRLDADELDTLMLGGARWAVEHGYGSADDLPYIEEHGCVDGAVPANVSSLAKKRQRGEMGTLGSGNHYLEVQRVAKIYNTRAAEAFGLAEGQVVVSIHCGSRGLGHQIGTEYLVSLAKAASRLGITLPDRELACAPIKSPEGQQYLGAMNAAINCALANRQILAHLARRVFTHHFRHVATRNTVRRLAQHLQGRAPQGRWPRAPALRAPQGRHARLRPRPSGPARALSRGRTARHHRRQHGHRLLHPRRHGREREPRVEFGQPRRRPRDEPQPGTATLARARGGR